MERVDAKGDKMMKNHLCRFVAIVLSASLLVLGGCATTAPSRFYILHSLSSSAGEQPSAAIDKELAVGVGPIVLPDYLDRPQIVSRTSQNKLQLGEFDKWGEPLKENFTNVLAENLSILLSTDRVFIYPWETSTPVDYQVAVDVIRFDGDSAGTAYLSARWTLYRGDGEEVLEMKKSSFSEASISQEYEALASALSKTLADLSRRIAETIEDISQ
jgi:uncharacterized lipoprotein YmbA